MSISQDFRRKGIKILNYLGSQLAMTNKLVVIINSLKVPKINKILLYEMKFLVPNYGCIQNPWLGGYRPQIPVLFVLCPQLNLMNLPPKKIPGYATAHSHSGANNISRSYSSAKNIPHSHSDANISHSYNGAKVSNLHVWTRTGVSGSSHPDCQQASISGPVTSISDFSPQYWGK